MRPLPPLEKRMSVELEIMALGVPSDQSRASQAGRRHESCHTSLTSEVSSFPPLSLSFPNLWNEEYD